MLKVQFLKMHIKKAYITYSFLKKGCQNHNKTNKYLRMSKYFKSIHWKFTFI